MYGPQYVCTFTRARRHDKVICKCTCHHIYIWVSTSRPRAERSLYKVYEARSHSQGVHIIWAVNDLEICT